MDATTHGIDDQWGRDGRYRHFLVVFALTHWVTPPSDENLQER
jgi:hypothetical protein